MGSKKKAALHGSTKVDKKTRKLAEREAELRAELERREAERKAKKKSKGKKGGKSKVDKAFVSEVKKKGKRKAEPAVEHVDITATPEAAIAPEPVIEDTAAIDASIKARLAEKRAERAGSAMGTAISEAEDRRSKAEYRAELDAAGESVDRDDAEAVRVHNLKAVKVGARLLTSNFEKAKLDKGTKPGYSDDGFEKVNLPGDYMEPPEQVAEIVETDHGREIAVGTPTSDEPLPFVRPSDAAKVDFETNGLHQYLIARPEDGKLVGYTRWTTYIDCLTDKKALDKWRMRVLLEGVAAADDMVDDVHETTAAIRDLIHRRDVAISKARKADRKGKLQVGELATLTNGAWSEFKKALDQIADDLFELGGGREKAQKGTDLHALTDLHDREGIQAVGDLLTAGQISPADLVDVEAYAEAMRKLGAKIVDIERVVVNDELKVAGRLDRTVMVKLPALYDPKTGELVRAAETRARRRVLDLKTGNVDYSLGTIAQQLEGYAGSLGYDLETHEREDLKLDRTTGILIHLPVGSGKATVHVVDLTLGRKGNRLAGEVRSFRNEGKRAINTKIDVLAAIDREAAD